MQQNYRPWSRVFTLAVAVTLLIVIATAIINPLFDRVVNWGMLAVVSFSSSASWSSPSAAAGSNNCTIHSLRPTLVPLPIPFPPLTRISSLKQSNPCLNRQFNQTHQPFFGKEP